MLFLAAGAVIHSVANEQNIYKLGGLSKVLPLSYIFILIGSLSLMGWPFYTGYYSKEYIIHTSFYTYVWSDLFLFWISNIAILLTTLYSTNHFLGPRSFEKGSYHTNRFINLLYSGNFISYLLLNFIVISVVNLWVS